MSSSATTARTVSICVGAACAGLIACGSDAPAPPRGAPSEAESGPSHEPEIAFEGEGEPWTTPVPRATCRQADSAETGMQGLGSDVRCNLDVKGRAAVEHSLSLAWYRECAYVNGQTATSVIDASDPTNPKLVKQLSTPGMQNNWESMKVHEGRGLLVGYQSHAPILDVYDIESDCAEPVLRKSYLLGGQGHAGNFSPDGTIYYASSLTTRQVFAVDVTDAASPRVITADFERTTHDLFVGKNGARGYFAFSDLVAHLGMGSLAIMDLSQVQARAPNAKGLLISETVWTDGWASQYPLPVTYRGRDYLVITDELGPNPHCLDPTKPPFGHARILDIQDETHPRLVSKIKTEAQDPVNCVAATAAAGTSFGVGTHYCSVDRQDDPRLLSCGLWAGGVRLFDIRNPWRPKEVAYFNVPGAQVPGMTRIRLRERELWFSTNTTFYVLHLPESVFRPILGS